MLPTTITRSCAITICRGQSTKWKQVTEFVITKGQANGTLPNYVYLGNTICLNCYNGIVTKSSAIFQQHAQTNTKQPETDEIEAIENTDESTNPLSFSKAIEMITNILYIRENREKKSILYAFDEFQEVMEREDARLRFFFDELYLSSNPLTKNKDRLKNNSYLFATFCAEFETSLLIMLKGS